MALDIALFAALAAWAVAGAYSSDAFHGLGAVLPPAALAACAAAGVGYRLTTLAHRLAPSLALIAVFAAVGWGACLAEAYVAAVVVWICACVMAVERLPLAVALAVVAVMMPGFALIGDSDWGAAVTVASVSLGGYALRLDAEARGAGFRLLTQERAAREAEAVSAALAERARIAREIHDVLAHSLSAQLVHLEAARLQIEREPEGALRDQILERVVAARGMAREGLEETQVSSTG
jgi:signal transduction histidine kinase